MFFVYICYVGDRVNQPHVNIQPTSFMKKEQDVDQYTVCQERVWVKNQWRLNDSISEFVDLLHLQKNSLI